jgi:hypothetical protein
MVAGGAQDSPLVLRGQKKLVSEYVGQRRQCHNKEATFSGSLEKEAAEGGHASIGSPANNHRRRSEESRVGATRHDLTPSMQIAEMEAGSAHPFDEDAD